MVFPRPHDIAAELFVNSSWVDIADDIRVASGIQISRGRPNESGRTPPAQCKFVLDNSSGNYSLRNPTGAYYGSLGRNTPLRIAVRTEVDTFTRTASNGWSSSDTGGAWTGVGVGGTVASSINVAAGKGTHACPSAGSYRLSYLADSLYGDVDVTATVSGLPANVLGNSLEPLGLIIGGVSTADYYWAQIVISSLELVYVRIMHFDGTEYAPLVLLPITYTGQDLKARFQLEGHTLRAKVWAASTNEPYAWSATANSTALSLKQIGRAKGWVGVRSGVAAGNSNSFPLVFSYDNFEVRNYRFTGEVSSWPTKWDLSGTLTDTQITASGITRRIGQGASPTPSAFYRAFTSLAVPPIVYWPMEEGKEATQFASGIGGAPLSIHGFPKLAANNDFPASDSIPVVSGADFGDWYSITGAANTGVLQTTFLLSIPDNGDTDTFSFIQVQNGGSATYWNVAYGTLNGGSVRVQAFDRGGGTLLTSAWIDFDLNATPMWASLLLVQNGANIDWFVQMVDVKTLALGALEFSGTLNSQTIGALTAVKVNPDRGLLNTAVGHLMSRNYFASLNDLSLYLLAYAGESAIARILRLSTENDVPFAYIYNGANISTQLGTQGLQSYLELVNEAAASDLGVMYEGRSTASIVYRARNSLYSQLPRLALDYTAGHVAAPFEPTEDDQNLRNGIKLTRKEGSYTRVEQTTGPLSVLDASAGGAGRYDSEVTQSLYSDAQTPYAASWLLFLGTIDEARYPAIGVNLLGFGRQLFLDSLAVDIGDRLTIDNPRSLDPNQISQIVQGYKETINSFSHEIVFNGSPESPYATVRLDVTALDKVDSGSSILATGYSSSATSLSVTTTNVTDLWKTGAVSIPITVAGENMLCTNVSGLTSPQTFTVTRSTNGVVKAQLAAAEVHVARRATLAY
jgi:hypothetical protein